MKPFCQRQLDKELYFGGSYPERDWEEDTDSDQDGSEYDWEFRPTRYKNVQRLRHKPSKEQQIEDAQRDREQTLRIAEKLLELAPELRDKIYGYLVSDPDMQWDRYEFKGISTASDEQFVKPEYKIFCPSYVTDKVAREAAECYYAINNFEVKSLSTPEGVFDIPEFYYRRGLPSLLNLLKEDIFGQGILPYKFIRRVRIQIYVHHLCPDIHIQFMDHSNAPRRERLQLDKLYEDLDSAFSLLPDKRKLDIRFYIKPRKPQGYSEKSEIIKAIERRNDRNWVHFLNIERGLLNVLEAIRKPVYDIKHAGASVAIRQYHEVLKTSHMDNFPTFDVFGHTAEEWEREKEEHIRQWGQYQPHRNYIERSLLVLSGKQRNDVFLKNLPQFRQRWGYEEYLDSAMFDESYLRRRIDYDY